MPHGEGRLGDPDDAKRSKSIENHRRWIEMAQFLASQFRKGNHQDRMLRVPENELHRRRGSSLLEMGVIQQHRIHFGRDPLHPLRICFVIFILFYRV